MTKRFIDVVEQNFTTCHLIDAADCFESLMQDLREHYHAQAPLNENELVLHYAYDCGLDLFLTENLGLLIKHTETDVRSMWQHGANKRVSEMRGSI